jgi:hypothetical protein
VFKQPYFKIDATGITNHLSFIANHAMTGNNQRNGIIANGTPNRSRVAF